MRPPRLLTATVTALAIAAAASGCSTRPPADTIVLYYKAGVGDDKKFAQCIQPGTAGDYPIDDETYYLPTSLRTWNIRASEGDSNQPIKSGSKPAGNQPGPQVIVFASADFYLNTDCNHGKISPIVQFWETLGRRYQLAKDGEEHLNEEAWKNMLLNTLIPAMEKAVREATRVYSADDLDANSNGAWGQMEHAMAPAFDVALREKLGGQFFCGVGFAGGKTVSWNEWVPAGVDTAGRPVMKEERRDGTCPPVRISLTNVTFADPAIAAARANVFKAEQDAKAALIAAQSQVAAAQTLSQANQAPGYVQLKELETRVKVAEACANSPHCVLVLSDGAVTVNPNTGAAIPAAGK